MSTRLEKNISKGSSVTFGNGVRVDLLFVSMSCGYEMDEFLGALYFSTSVSVDLLFVGGITKPKYASVL
jgi:hypothetical protein